MASFTCLAVTQHLSPWTSMLTTQPHLRTRRPSPTTVEYTVSTSPELTLPLRLLIVSAFLIRVAVGLCVLLLIYAKFAISSYASPFQAYTKQPTLFSNDFIWYCVQIIASSPLGLLSTRIATKIPLFILLPCSLVVLYTIFLRIYTEESLLILRGLGIQISTSSETYLSTAATRFIPTEKIQDILVNEAFRGFEVRYYLVVIVEGEEDVVVVFPRLLPGRKIVETVWRGVRGCLYEPGGTESSKG